MQSFRMTLMPWKLKLMLLTKKLLHFAYKILCLVFDRGAENNTIILNIKNVDAVVAQFKLELDGQSSLQSETV